MALVLRFLDEDRILQEFFDLIHVMKTKALTIWHLVAQELNLPFQILQLDSNVIEWWELERSRTFNNVFSVEAVVVAKITAKWRMWKLAWDHRARGGRLVDETET